MESPPARLVPLPETDDSVLHHSYTDGPSSPFVTEADSRLVSKTWDAAAVETVEQEDPNTDTDKDADMFATPLRSAENATMMGGKMENKENVPLVQMQTGKLLSPMGPATPDQKSPQPEMVNMSEARRGSADAGLMPPPPSARKAQTPKRSPLKPVRGSDNAQTPRPTTTTTTSTPRNNSFESELTSHQRYESRITQSVEEASGIDDTCFSTFSEVPELTTWARMGQSPTKRTEQLRTPAKHNTDATPRTTRKRPSPSRSPSPTPRRAKAHSISQDGTTFLIDFTQQIEGIGSRQPSPGKSTTQPDLLTYMNNQRSPHKTNRQSYTTPHKQSNIMNLLDFELPPAPTPRSVPTITVRELESLKSSYLSQISSLKATLSGREAEVESLKRAVGDAERRVGEAQESLRDEKNRCEYAEQEKAGWEKRGQEVEALLKTVKEEVLKSEAEKEDLLRKMEETERRAEDAETRAIKAEERFADSLAARAGADGVDSTEVEQRVERLVQAQIDSKIEAVSRELHSVYKEKHERKVATLKKSYEARSEKKCADLQHRLEELEKQNEDLLAAKDATFSGPVADATFSGEAEAELKYQIEEQKAQFARLEAEIQASRKHQEQLEKDLRQERIEKGDLVAAVDEMLLLQAESGPAQGPMSVVEDFRKSISRPASALGSGLRAPGSGLPAPGGSKIGGLARGSSAAGKGGMMSRIERMGNGRGGHE